MGHMISKFEENDGTLISKICTVSHFHQIKCSHFLKNLCRTRGLAVVDDEQPCSCSIPAATPPKQSHLGLSFSLLLTLLLMASDQSSPSLGLFLSRSGPYSRRTLSQRLQAQSAGATSSLFNEPSPSPHTSYSIFNEPALGKRSSVTCCISILNSMKPYSQRDKSN